MRAVTGTTEQDVYQKKAAFTNAFVVRSEFATLAALNNHDYVATLMERYNLPQITTNHSLTTARYSRSCSLV